MSSVTLDVLLLLCAILQAVPVLRSRVLFLSYCTSAQRLTCARAQGVALLGGYSVYSEAVPESLLSLSLSLALSGPQCPWSSPLRSLFSSSHLRPLRFWRLLTRILQIRCCPPVLMLFDVFCQFPSLLFDRTGPRLTADKSHTLSVARRAGQRRILRLRNHLLWITRVIPVGGGLFGVSLLPSDPTGWGCPIPHPRA